MTQYKTISTIASALTSKPVDDDSNETFFKCDEIPLKGKTEDESRELTNFSSNHYEIWYPKPVECQATETSHSDLLSGVYEGGLKIWECTQDLADFLTKSDDDTEKTLLADFEGKRILDLGCGVGVLGVLAMTHNAKCVTFQDYNKEVIETTTISTILCNKSIYEEMDLNNVNLFSGDWDSFVDVMKEKHAGTKFDYILTSETIYNEKYYKKLLNVFRELLADDGTVFLAAKTIYFGVGGGMRSFEKALTDTKEFKSDVVWKSEVGVLREILKINKISS
ncbi:histidine protein methyltransferase 1 homolog [Culicoides brevitarsis]|uniref:histidine protein methyltransferase 1 homolog n=1 Tax=Culicoides brevitarsis TaxID=469753 RepID=UPI00307C263A